jgi:hypothetical protein
MLLISEQESSTHQQLLQDILQHTVSTCGGLNNNDFDEHFNNSAVLNLFPADEGVLVH